jgi:hypothetical protein
MQSQTDAILRTTVALITSSGWWTVAARDRADSGISIPEVYMNSASYLRFDPILPFMSIATPLAHK